MRQCLDTHFKHTGGSTSFTTKSKPTLICTFMFNKHWWSLFACRHQQFSFNGWVGQVQVETSLRFFSMEVMVRRALPMRR
mgnify:CR=1 FL=1